MANAWPLVGLQVAETARSWQHPEADGSFWA
jgi:hypothetical protein